MLLIVHKVLPKFAEKQPNYGLSDVTLLKILYITNVSIQENTHLCKMKFITTRFRSIKEVAFAVDLSGLSLQTW